MITRLVLGFLVLSSAGCVGPVVYPSDEFDRSDPSLFSQYFTVDSGLDETDGSVEVFLYPAFGKALLGQRCTVTTTISMHEVNVAGDDRYQLVSMSLVDIAKDKLADQSIYFVVHSDEVAVSIVYSSRGCGARDDSNIAAAGRLVFAMPRRLLLEE